MSYNKSWVEDNKTKIRWFWQHETPANTTVGRGASSRGIKLGLSLGIILLALFFVSTNLSAEDFTPRNEAGLKYTLVTVQEGDSLGKLVSRAGLNINTNYLIEQTLKYNNLKGTYLTVGQKIHIPCAE